MKLAPLGMLAERLASNRHPVRLQSGETKKVSRIGSPISSSSHSNPQTLRTNETDNRQADQEACGSLQDASTRLPQN